MNKNRASFNKETDEANDNYYQMMDHFHAILRLLGEDVEREGLADTPKRITRAWLEMTKGLEEDPGKHLLRQFETASNSMVIVKDIPFNSLCEHHFLPFTGKAHIAYVPGHGEGDKVYRIAGLSKFARVVEGFAARPQVQENLTHQIAQAIEDTLGPGGCMVVVEASHSCMSLRGVRSEGSTTITSAVTGIFDENADGIKDEALSLILR